MSHKVRTVALVVALVAIGGLLPPTAWAQEADPSPSSSPETPAPSPSAAPDPTPSPTDPPAPTPAPTAAPVTLPPASSEPRPDSDDPATTASTAPADATPAPSPEEPRDEAPEADPSVRAVPTPCELVDCADPESSSAAAIAALIAEDCTDAGCPAEVVESISSALGLVCGPDLLRSCTRLFHDLTESSIAGGCDAACAGRALDLALSLAGEAVAAPCPAGAAFLCISQSFEAARSYAAMVSGTVNGAGAAAYRIACASEVAGCADAYRSWMRASVLSRLDGAYEDVCVYAGAATCAEKQETLAQFVMWGYFDASCGPDVAGCAIDYPQAVAGVLSDLGDQAATFVCATPTLATCPSGTRASGVGVLGNAVIPACGSGDCAKGLTLQIQRGVAGTCGVTLETVSVTTRSAADVSNPCVDQVMSVVNSVLVVACGSTDAVTCANTLIETINRLLISVCSQSVVSSSAWAALTPPMWTSANVSHPCVDTAVAAVNLVLRTACGSTDAVVCANNLIQTINELLITACTVTTIDSDSSPPTVVEGLVAVNVSHPCADRAFEAVNLALKTVCGSTDAVTCANNLVRTIDELLVTACTLSNVGFDSSPPEVNGIELLAVSHPCVERAFEAVNSVLTTACGSTDAAVCAQNLLRTIDELLVSVCTQSIAGSELSPPRVVNGVELSVVSHPCVDKAFAAVNLVLTTVCASTDAATCANNLIRTVDELLVAVCTQAIAETGTGPLTINGIEVAAVSHPCVDKAFAAVNLVLRTACGSEDAATCANNLIETIQELVVSVCTQPVLDTETGPVTVNGEQLTNLSHPCVETAMDVASAVLETACRSADAATCATNLLTQVNDLLIFVCETAPVDGDPLEGGVVALAHPCVEAALVAAGQVVSTVCGSADAVTCAEALLTQIGDLLADACAAGPAPTSPLSGLTSDLAGTLLHECVDKVLEVVNLVLSTVCAEEEAAECATGILADVAELLAVTCGLTTGLAASDPQTCAQAVMDLVMSVIPVGCAAVDVELALVDCPAPVADALEELIEAALEQTNATVVDYQVYPRRIDPSATTGPRAVNVYAQVTLGPWRVEIRDANGQPVRVFPGFTGVTNVTWDGRDALGTVVPHGAYEVVLLAPKDDAATTESAWVFVGPGPTIGGVFPSSVAIGESLTLTGSGFTRGLGVFGVTIGDEDAHVLSWSDNQVVVQVPPSVAPGTYDVTLTAADADAVGQVTVKNHIPVTPSIQSYLTPGLIRVELRPGASMGAVAAAFGDSAFQATFPADYPALAAWYDVTVPAGSESARIKAYAGHPDVVFAEPVVFSKPVATPNDERYPNQWYLMTQPADNDVDAPEAWSIRKGSSSVTVAVLDTQVGSHPDLDVVETRAYTSGCAHHVWAADHGTWVAGIAAARTNNATGVAGMGWGTRIREYRLGVASQGSCYISSAWSSAILEAAGKDEVANMSFGGYQPFRSEQQAVNEAWAKGLVLVAAAGNENTSKPHYPSAYTNVLSVGALNRSNQRANFGSSTSGSNYGSTVDLYAPGQEITSTARTTTGTATYGTNGQGTSFASPLVAGAVALLRAHAPDVRAATLVDALKSTTQGSPNRISVSSALKKLIRIVLPSGIFVRASNSSTIYFLDDGGVKRRVTTPVLQSWGIPSATNAQIAVVPPELLAAGYPVTTDRLGFRPGTLVRQSGSTTTYVVTTDGSGGWRRGQKRALPPHVLLCLQYSEARIVSVGKSDLDLHPTGLDAGCDRHPNGTLIKTPGILGAPDTLEVLQGDKRRRFQTAQLAGSYGYVPDAVTATAGDLLLPAGSDMGFRPGRLLRYSGKTWVVTAAGTDFARAAMRPFSSTAAISCYKLQKVPPLNATAAEAALHSSGTGLAC